MGGNPVAAGLSATPLGWLGLTDWLHLHQPARSESDRTVRRTQPHQLQPMSASPQPDAATNDSDPKDERLANYLRSRVEDGELYFKSKFIAEDVSLSSKEIGALIVKLQDSVDDLSIERWSYTGATTWRVEQTS